MLGRLRFQRAVEIGPEFSVAALELLDLGLEAADARLDAVLVILHGGDLGVPRGDRRTGARQLRGKPVALRRGVRPAARQVGEVDAEVLSLTIERLIGRLQRRLPVDDLLQVVDPCHLLTRDGPLLRHFGLQRGGSSTLAAQLLLGLLEQLLVALQDAALLAVRLEKLIQGLAQAGLKRAGIVQRQVRSPGVEREGGGPPRRAGGGGPALLRRGLWGGRLDRGRRYFRGLRPAGP